MGARLNLELTVTNEYGSDRGNQYIDVWMKDDQGKSYLWRTTWKTKLYEQYGSFLSGDRIVCSATQVSTTLGNTTELARLDIKKYTTHDGRVITKEAIK